MKIKEIKELTVEELQLRKRDLNHEIFNLRLQKQTGQLEKPSQLREIRREIARIETVLSDRRAAAQA